MTRAALLASLLSLLATSAAAAFFSVDAASAEASGHHAPRAGGAGAADLGLGDNGGCCAGGGPGDFAANLTIVTDYGDGIEPDSAFIAIQAQERFLVALGSSISVEDASAGLYLRRCVWTSRVWATLWTPTICLTFPLPDVCLEGSRMCVGRKRSPWPEYSHRATLDGDTSTLQWTRHAKGGDLVMGRVWTLEDTCMPTAMLESTGPAVRGGRFASLAPFLAAVAGLHDHEDVRSAIIKATQVAEAELSLEPTDLNWMMAVFSNSTTVRPDDSVFHSPHRCLVSFPDGVNLN